MDKRQHFIRNCYYNLRMTTHIAIFHPDHAGILSAAIHLNATKVILLHRKEDNCEGVKWVLRTRGIKFQCEAVSFDTNTFRNQIEHIINQHKEEKLMLNASNSYHKWVMLCFEQFIYHDFPVYMVDKFTNQLSWLHQESEDQDEDISCHLKVHEYLMAFNTQVLNSGQKQAEPSQSRSLTHWLIDQIGSHDKQIAKLNYMAMMADGNHQHSMSHAELKDHDLQELLRHFKEADMIEVHGKKISFINKDNRFYCNGGWLENHVFSLMYGMRAKRPSLTDINKGMEIVRHQGTVKNEIDVIAMANNRLHVIECKTKKFGKSTKSTAEANSIIYRLDTLKSLTGGLSGRAMLISYQAINKYTYQRAQDLGIHICAHEQLKQLERHLYQFIDS